MMHYKPLYGNNTAVDGFRNNPEEVSDVPSVFNDDVGLWARLVAQFEIQYGSIPAALEILNFESLNGDTQLQLLNMAMNWDSIDPDAFEAESNEAFALVVQAVADAEDELSPVQSGEEEISEDELVGPPVPAGREEALEVTMQALSRVYAGQDLGNHDISFVLLSAIEEIQQSISKELNVQEVVDALEAFNNIAFPTYVPEELISCLFLSAIGDTATVDAEEEAMITDDTRDDALCSQVNQSIILAAFGSEAAAKFTTFCEAAPASRMIEWEDVAGRNLHTLLGVSRPAFEQFVLDAFDERTAADLAKAGSEALTTLVEGVIKDTKADPKSVIRQPRPTPTVTVSASGKEPSLLVSGAVIAGVAVGLTALYRKLRS